MCRTDIGEIVLELASGHIQQSTAYQRRQKFDAIKWPGPVGAMTGATVSFANRHDMSRRQTMVSLNMNNDTMSTLPETPVLHIQPSENGLEKWSETNVIIPINGLVSNYKIETKAPH